MTQSLDHIKCFILDMDGTIYLGGKVFDSVYGFLDRIKESGREFYFFTNNSSKSTCFYVDKLKKLNIDISEERMLISNHVCIDYLKEHYNKKPIYVVGTNYLIDELTDVGVLVVNAIADGQTHGADDAELVVLGFDTELTYEKLKIACDLVRKGVPIIGLNPDLNCPVEGGFIPDCGSIAKLIEASTGVKIEFLGKPSRKTLDFIINRTGFKEDEIAFVGDRLYTDIAIAKNTKATSILVLSGETQKGDWENGEIQPDFVFNSIADIL